MTETREWKRALTRSCDDELDDINLPSIETKKLLQDQQTFVSPSSNHVASGESSSTKVFFWYLLIMIWLCLWIFASIDWMLLRGPQKLNLQSRQMFKNVYWPW